MTSRAPVGCCSSCSLVVVELLTLGNHGNCYSGNVFDTSFSLIGVLPECDDAGQ